MNNGYIKVYLKDVTRFTEYILVYTRYIYCQTPPLLCIRLCRPCDADGSQPHAPCLLLSLRLLLECLLNTQTTQAGLATSKTPQPQVNLVDIAAPPSVSRCCVGTAWDSHTGSLNPCAPPPTSLRPASRCAPRNP